MFSLLLFPNPLFSVSISYSQLFVSLTAPHLISLLVFLSFSFFVSLFPYLYFCFFHYVLASTFLPTSLTIPPATHLSTHVSTRLSIYVSTYLFVYLSIHLTQYSKCTLLKTDPIKSFAHFCSQHSSYIYSQSLSQLAHYSNSTR